jgi:hypothetical protein
VARGSSGFGIDHLVALSEIDAPGASTWSLERRAAFANDPASLVAL